MGLGNAIGIGIPTVNLGLGGGSEPVEERFIVQVQTDNAGSSADNEFTIPWIGTYDVDWGDGNTDTGVVDTQTHTYASAGIYDVAVTATTGRIVFNDGGDKLKLLDIKNWGTCEWTSMVDAFKGCSNLDVTATDIPNFNSVTDAHAMFWKCSSLIANPSIDNWDMSNVTKLGDGYQQGMFSFALLFNQPIGSWDVSNVTTMEGMFGGDGGDMAFNQPLNNWDVSNVTDMSLMFRNCSNFNQPLNNWDLSSLNRMPGMFRNARAFDQDLGDWDVSNVSVFATGFLGPFTDAIAFNNGGSDSIKNWDVSNNNGQFGGQYNGGFFKNAESFNQPVNDWDVSNVTDMRNVFRQTLAFNQPLDNWDTSNVTIMSNMFRDAAAFDQSLAAWDISQVTDFTNFFLNGNSLSIANYDATLISWAAQTPQQNININFSNSQYSYEAAAARQTLIDTYGWTITDGGQTVSPEFIIQVQTDNVGTSNDDQFTLPWTGTYDVDWGDGVVETGVTNTQTHTYPSAGTYDIKVTATTGNIRFRSTGEGRKLIKVKNWGTCQWTTFQEVFYGCNSLLELPTSGVPNLSGVTSFLSAFYDTVNLENWGTISNWDFSNVTNVVAMFSRASRNITTPVYNINISNWNFGSTDLRLFSDFNRDSSVLTDIGSPNNWDISNVTKAPSFGGTNKIDTSAWNFSSWDVTSLTSATIFTSSTLALSVDNYDATLISWAAQNVNNNVTANFGGSKYSLGGAAEAARNTLINTYGWTFTDGGGVYKPVSGLLYEYPNPTSAYSLRNLAGFQGGLNPAVVRVRRSNDNVEQDFTATEITDGTLTTFTGVNDGLVVKIYDQSYELQDIYQNTAARQAKIVDAGSLILEGGLPSLQTGVGAYRTADYENLNYYTNEDTFTYTLHKPDGSAVANKEFFIDTAGGAEYGREGFSFGNTYARVNYPYGTTVSSISYNRNLTDDIYQPLVWESYPSDSTLNNRLKLYNQDGLLADGNTANTIPTGQGSTRGASLFGGEGGTFRALDGNWQETILYKEEDIPNRYNFLSSINSYYPFPAPSGLLLDIYTGAAAAYSLRSLANTTTNVVRVRRSSDNTEQDFTATEITDGTLTTFTGVNDGFVTTWYDQSGNNRNATQSTASKQPMVVSGGVVLLSNNKPSLRFKEGSTKRSLGQPLQNELNSSFSVLSVVQGETTSAQYEGLLATNTMMKLARVSYGNWGTYPNGVTNTNLYTGTINLITMISSDGNAGNFYTNNNSDGSFTSTDGQSERVIGGINNQQFNGYISEMVIYPSDQSTNRAGIETNINTEYSIY